MRQPFIFILIICLLIIPNFVFAHNHIDKDKWNVLNETSDQVLQLVKQEKFAEAKQLLHYFSEQFLDISRQYASLSMTELKIITISYDKALGAVTSVSMPLEDRIMNVTELRLVVDAVSAEHHPLWVHTEKTVLQCLTDLEELANKQDSQVFHHRLNDFLRQYVMIRPALMVSVEQTQFQKINSQVEFLDRHRSNLLGTAKLSEHLQMMRTEFEDLYNRTKEDNADPSLLWVIFSIGGMIVVSLSYVGWKKYQAEKRKQQLREKAGKR